MGKLLKLAVLQDAKSYFPWDFAKMLEVEKENPYTPWSSLMDQNLSNNCTAKQFLRSCYQSREKRTNQWHLVVQVMTKKAKNLMKIPTRVQQEECRFMLGL